MPIAFLALIPRVEGWAAPESVFEQAAAALPFEPASTISHASGGASVTAWSTDAHSCIASDFVRHPRGLGLLNGYGFHRRTSAPLRAAALCDAEMDMASLWNSFDGEWSALTIEEGRVRAASSALGTEHLYQTTMSNCIAIANRARLLWALRRATGESLDPDHEVLSQLVTLTYPFCHQRTAVRKIELVSPNVWLERKASDLRIVEHSHHEDDGAPTETIDWSMAKDHLVRAASWLEHADRPVLCALTGGKDSRLVLAALQGAGRIESVDRFYISAPPQHADAIVASSIAKQFGLTFEQRGALSAPSLREAFGRHVAYTEGLLNGWDLKHRPVRERVIGVHGLAGELYRRKTKGPLPDMQHAQRSLFGSALDFAGLVHRDLVEWQRGLGRTWLEQESSQGMSCDFAAEAFYRTQRLPRWVGQGKLRDALCGVQFNPLYSRDLVKIYNQLPHLERSGERVHFELMCHLWKDLAALPFAHDRWDRAMVGRSQWSLPPSDPVGHSSPVSGAGWQVHALREQWPEVTEWLLDSAETLRPIIGRKKLESFVEACRPLVFGSSSWRTRMTHPLMVLRVGGRASAALPRLLSLCTILTLHHELRSPLERTAILSAE